MLVLSRKPGETLIIGRNITVTLVSVERGRVRLAFDAPSDVIILRAELAGPRDQGKELDPDLAAKPAEWKNAGARLVW